MTDTAAGWARQDPAPRPGLVLVSRCVRPAAVPSKVVRCDYCDARCWLSRKTGASTMALAAQVSENGQVKIMCSDPADPGGACFERFMADLERRQGGAAAGRSAPL